MPVVRTGARPGWVTSSLVLRSDASRHTPRDQARRDRWRAPAHSRTYADRAAAQTASADRLCDGERAPACRGRYHRAGPWIPRCPEPARGALPARYEVAARRLVVIRAAAPTPPRRRPGPWPGKPAASRTTLRPPSSGTVRATPRRSAATGAAARRASSFRARTARATARPGAPLRAGRLPGAAGLPRAGLPRAGLPRARAGCLPRPGAGCLRRPGVVARGRSTAGRRAAVLPDRTGVPRRGPGVPSAAARSGHPARVRAAVRAATVWGDSARAVPRVDRVPTRRGVPTHVAGADLPTVRLPAPR